MYMHIFTNIMTIDLEEMLLCTFTHSNCKFDEIVVDFMDLIFTGFFLLLLLNPAVVARKYTVFKYQAHYKNTVYSVVMVIIIYL